MVSEVCARAARVEGLGVGAVDIDVADEGQRVEQLAVEGIFGRLVGAVDG